MADYLNVTTLESVLVETFQLILENHAVSPKSNFFACGGDSLSALELTDRLSARLGIDIDVAELPLWADVSAIAEFLRDRLAVAVRESPG
jgi:acyl carrier protein